MNAGPTTAVAAKPGEPGYWEPIFAKQETDQSQTGSTYLSEVDTRFLRIQLHMDAIAIRLKCSEMSKP